MAGVTVMVELLLLQAASPVPTARAVAAMRIRRIKTAPICHGD